MIDPTNQTPQSPGNLDLFKQEEISENEPIRKSVSQLFGLLDKGIKNARSLEELQVNEMTGVREDHLTKIGERNTQVGDVVKNIRKLNPEFETKQESELNAAGKIITESDIYQTARQGFQKIGETWNSSIFGDKYFETLIPEATQFTQGLITQFGQSYNKVIDQVAGSTMRSMRQAAMEAATNSVSNIVSSGLEFVEQQYRTVKKKGYENLLFEVGEGRQEFGEIINYLRDNYDWKDGNEMSHLHDTMIEELRIHGVTLTDEEIDMGWDFFGMGSTIPTPDESLGPRFDNMAGRLEESRSGVWDWIDTKEQSAGGKILDMIYSINPSNDTAGDKRQEGIETVVREVTDEARLLNDLDLTSEEQDLVDDVLTTKSSDFLRKDHTKAGEVWFDEERFSGLQKKATMLRDFITDRRSESEELLGTQETEWDNELRFGRQYPGVDIFKVLGESINTVYGAGGMPLDYGDPDTYEEGWKRNIPTNEYTNHSSKFADQSDIMYGPGMIPHLTHGGVEQSELTPQDMIEDVLSGNYHKRMFASPEQWLNNPAYRRTYEAADKIIAAGIAQVVATLGEVPQDEVNIYTAPYMPGIKAAASAVHQTAIDLFGRQGADDLIKGLNPLTLSGGGSLYQSLINRGLMKADDKKSDIDDIFVAKLDALRDKVAEATTKLDLLYLKQDALLGTELPEPTPEEVRLWWVAKKLKETGFEDPTGNDWTGPTVGEAITRHTTAAINNEMDPVRAAYILELSSDSYAMANSLAKGSSGGGEAINTSISKLYQQTSNLGVKTAGGLIDAFIGGNSGIATRIQDGEVPSERSVAMITETAGAFNTLFKQNIIEEFSDEEWAGMSVEMQSSLIGPILNVDSILRGQWGLDVNELTTVQLGGLARTLQTWNQKHKRTDTPAMIGTIGTELARRANMITGLNEQHRSASPLERQRALVALRQMGRIVKSSEGQYGPEQFFADVPPLELVILKSLAHGVMDADDNNRSLGSSTAEALMTVDVAERAEMEGTPLDPSILDKINSQFRVHNKILDTYSDALIRASQMDAGEQTRGLSRARTKSTAAIDAFKKGSYLFDLNSTTSTNDSLDNAGILQTTYSGNVGRGTKPGDIPDENTARLVTLVGDNIFLTENAIGPSGVSGKKIEEILMREIAGNSTSRRYLDSLIIANSENGSPMTTLTLLEQTLTMATLDGIMFVRTGPDEKQIQGVSFDPKQPGLKEAMRNIPNPQYDHFNDLGKMNNAMVSRPTYINPVNRNTNSFNQHHNEFFLSAGDLARTQLKAWGVTTEEDGDLIDSYVTQMINEERALFVSREEYKSRSYQDILFGALDRYMSEKGVPQQYTRISSILRTPEPGSTNVEDVDDPRYFPRIYDVRSEITGGTTQAFGLGSHGLSARLKQLNRASGRTSFINTDNTLTEETMIWAGTYWEDFKKTQASLNKHRGMGAHLGAAVKSMAGGIYANVMDPLDRSFGDSSFKDNRGTENMERFLLKLGNIANSWTNYRPFMEHYGMWEGSPEQLQDAQSELGRRRINETKLKEDDGVITTIAKTLLNL